MQIQVRRMRKEDVAVVKQIEIECGLSPWSISDYLNELERKDFITLVAADSDEIVGFLCARLIMYHNRPFPDSSAKAPPSGSTPSAKPLDNPEPEAELYNIGVRASHRRRKIGTILLQNLLDLAETHQVTKIWLEVRVSNHAARSFYQQKGFADVTVRRNLYTNPSENGILMVRTR